MPLQAALHPEWAPYMWRHPGPPPPPPGRLPEMPRPRLWYSCGPPPGRNDCGYFRQRESFAWVGQSIGDSALASVLPVNTQAWSPLGWTGWISFSTRDSQESSPTPQFKSINSSVLSFLYSSTLTSIHDYWKTIVSTRSTFVGKLMSLLFSTLSRFDIAFLPRRRVF